MIQPMAGVACAEVAVIPDFRAANLAIMMVACCPVMRWYAHEDSPVTVSFVWFCNTILSIHADIVHNFRRSTVT